MSTQLPVSQQTPILSDEQVIGTEISIGMLAYFRGRLSNRVHELVLTEFAAQEREGNTNRAELARKIGRKPEQITRWLGSPGNWTMDTFSDLLLGMGLEPELSVRSLPNMRAPLSIARHAPSISTYFWDIQTHQEVAQDIVNGKHKSAYISLRMQTAGSTATPLFEIAPIPSLPHSTTFDVPFAIKENEHVHI